MPIPDALQAQAEEWRERLMDHVAEASDDLMERYLEGEPIADDELVDAFKDLVVRGELFPVACGAASRNVGTRALLDLIVDGLPSPARAERIHAHDRSGDDVVLELEGSGVAAYCFKTIADPHVGKLSLLRVFAGRIGPDTPLVNERTHHKERVGQILSFQGRSTSRCPTSGPGDIGAVPKLKDVLHGRRAGRHRSRPRDRSGAAARAGRLGRGRAEARRATRRRWARRSGASPRRTRRCGSRATSARAS